MSNRIRTKDMRGLLASAGSPFTAAVFATVGIIAVARLPTPAWSTNARQPNALGTSRVLTLEPGTLTRVGVMQYPQSLPWPTRKSCSLSTTAHCRAIPTRYSTSLPRNA